MGVTRGSGVQWAVVWTNGVEGRAIWCATRAEAREKASTLEHTLDGVTLIGRVNPPGSKAYQTLDGRMWRAVQVDPQTMPDL